MGGRVQKILTRIRLRAQRKRIPKERTTKKGLAAIAAPYPNKAKLRPGDRYTPFPKEEPAADIGKEREQVQEIK